MTIDEAMRILDDIVECGEYEGDPYDSAAVKLGIEALKQVKYLREIYILHQNEFLPGETEG